MWPWARQFLRYDTKCTNDERLTGLHQNQNFCAANDTIKTAKRQPTECEKIVGNHVSDKGMYPEYIKDPYNSIIKENPI